MSDSDTMFLPEDAPDGAADTDPVDIGGAIDVATKEIFGDETDATAAQDGTGGGLDPAEGSSPGAIEQIGAAVREAFEYSHDVDDEPPARTGPYPAGGPS